MTLEPGDPFPSELLPSAAAVRREFTLLALLAVIAVAVFFATHAVADANRAVRRSDAQAWFDEGHRALAGGRREEALDRMRRAVALDPLRLDYRLSLAEALSGAGRDGDARTVLEGLRQRFPESPDINLQLARVESRAGQVDAAGRYYQLALSALWPEREADRRRAIRFELIDYLLAQHRTGRALSELLVLNADLPTAMDDQIRMGRLFLAAGDPRRAAERFDAVLKTTPADRRALAGSGLVAFAQGDYARAIGLLAGVPDEGTEVADARAIAHLVIDRDPLAPRLGARERTRRLRATVDEVQAQVQSCLARADPSAPGVANLAASLDPLEALVGAVALAESSATRRRAPVTLDRDQLEDGVEQLLRVVRNARAARCGPSSTLDRAVELIAARHALSLP